MVNRTKTKFMREIREQEKKKEFDTSAYDNSI